MPPLEEYLEHADDLAQHVMEAWRVEGQEGNDALLPTQFKALLDKACLYQHARKLADNHREHNVLSEKDEARRKGDAGSVRASVQGLLREARSNVVAV